MDEDKNRLDTALVIAFGGPDKPEDIRPFLAQVTKGRVPPERLEAVARHYELFEGKSPVKEVTCKQAEALETTLRNEGTPLPVCVGMRNWHPFLKDTIGQMKRAGVKGAVAVIMSVYQSRSSWDQYKEDVARAIDHAGGGLRVVYTEPLFDQPEFLEAVSIRVRQCLEEIPLRHRPSAHILFTAHSLPFSDPQVEVYEKQVHDSAASVASILGHPHWQAVYQSRSGRPHDPWLEPDVNTVLRDLGAHEVKHVIAVPIGFVCDNIEVLYDLDIEAMDTAKKAGVTFHRAKTVGDHHLFIKALARLVLEAVKDCQKGE
ncbi:MAG: ferrochelatase [Thermodesulfobacteriota bacterium]|nr:ferrochelatase [Thermodesulfobacteriota bacterium]